MNKKRIVIMIVILVLVIILGLWIIGIIEKDDNMKATIKAVVVEVDENKLLAMGTEYKRLI